MPRAAAHFPVKTYTRVRSKADIGSEVHKVNLWIHTKLIELVAHQVFQNASLAEFSHCVWHMKFGPCSSPRLGEASMEGQPALTRRIFKVVLSKRACAQCYQ